MKEEGTKSKVLFLVTAVCMVLRGAVNVAVAICMMNTVDAALTLDMGTFVRALAFMLGVAILEFAVGMFSRFMLQSYCKCNLVRVKENYYRKLLCDGKQEEMDISAFSTDIDLLYGNRYFNRCMLVFYSAQLIFSVISIIVLSWKVAIVVLVMTFLPLLVPALLQKGLRKTTDKYAEGMNAYLGFIQDTLQGLHEIRTYAASAFFTGIHDKRNKEAEALRLKNKMMTYFNSSLSDFVGSLSFMAAIAACGFLTVKGEITMGTLIAVIQLLNSVVSPIGSISSAAGEISATGKLAEKYKAAPEEKAAADNGPLARIEVAGLGYSYDGQTPVFSGVNLCFERGRRYAVLGKSGVGKSTLAKVLSGALGGYDGEIVLTDLEGGRREISQAEGLIQYVAQEPYLFKLSAEDNVYFGKPEGAEEMHSRIGKLGIEELFLEPETVLANRDRISGGQKQRLVLARALSHKPDVLILDEPTANLDEATAERVMDYIMEADCGILIVITHSADEKFLSRFDEVIRLEG